MINNIKRAIPNTLTCLNLFSGCLACFSAFYSDFEITFICVLLSALFDFCDGMVARALKVSSPIGKELDSLADDISFGLVPAVVVFMLMRDCTQQPPLSSNLISVLPFSAFLIAVFSALRLAKFNIDTRQAHSFIGLPTPANTLFWISFAVGYEKLFSSLNIWILLAMTIISSTLLVAEIPMFSLKFANLKWKENKLRYIFLITIIPFFLLGKICLAAIILWYIILSVITCRKTINKT